MLPERMIVAALAVGISLGCETPAAFPVPPGPPRAVGVDVETSTVQAAAQPVAEIIARRVWGVAGR